MSQLWTIIFVTFVAIAWGLAAWHDHEDEKRRGPKGSVHKKRQQQR